MEGCPLLSLPSEILCGVIRFLPPIYIARFRAVCTQIKDNIDHSPELKRLIELGIKGYQPSRYFSGCWSEEIHERFLESQRRLLTMTPISTETHSLPARSMAYDDGLQGCCPSGLFVPPGNSGNIDLIDIMPYRSHSVAKPITWSQEYGRSTGTPIGYGLSPREGLMVVVYFHESDQGMEMEAQFQALSPTSHDITPHPRIIGAESISTRLTRTALGLPSAMVDICGDDVIIKLNLNRGGQETLWIISWVSGITHLVMDPIYDARFLGPGKVLIVSPSECVQLSLLYLGKNLESLRFALPIPVSVASGFTLVTSPAARYNAATQEPFERHSLAWEFDCHLDICALRLRVDGYSQEALYLIVMRVQSFEAFRRQGNSGEGLISWDAWGPQSTRWFEISGPSPGFTIYGSQLYWDLPRGVARTLFGSPPHPESFVEAYNIRSVAILDFNPRNMTLAFGTDQSAQWRLCRDTWEDENHLLTRMVTCSLPFVIYEVPQAGWSRAMAHEGSYIVDILGTNAQQTLRVRSFVPPL
ncbi:hypothetical protein M408DRAFT_330626 [Serendipita vermifera MAFF 305830]|uniref:F-box domain-containing protein n=1 Tax=Serendipita vermifera MAFF 305830 TaxID=933852 RepID=A0A0C3APJ2_SERVB|nr:hypothetical protein M408DRAFT_330626 [Serendipita vermifera MAFF 305830]